MAYHVPSSSGTPRRATTSRLAAVARTLTRTANQMVPSGSARRR
jgi:hypothetical protein